MRKIILLVLLALLLAAPSQAEDRLAWGGSMMMVGGTAAAGGASNFCDGFSGLFCEDLEGTAACGDGSHTNCRYTYTLANWTTTDFNYATSPAPFDGAASLYLDSSSGAATAIKTFSASGTVYSKFIFSSAFVSVGVGDSYRFMQYDDEAHGLCAAQVKNVAGTLRFSVMNDSGSADGSTLTFAASTTYYIWLDYQKGAGTGYCKMYASTTDSKPGTVEAELTSQNLNYDASRVQILVFAGSVDQNIYDDIKLQATAF